MNKIPTWKLIYLKIEQIEIDKSNFNWFPYSLTEEDSNSILKYGIRFPILVHEKEESKYFLLDGFKRIKWINSSEMQTKRQNLSKKIFCIVIPKEVPFFELLMIRFETLPKTEKNFSGYNVCSLLVFLNKVGFPKNEIVENLFPRLGLESSSRLAIQLTNIGGILMNLDKDNNIYFPDFIKTLTCQDLTILNKFSENEIILVLNFVSDMEIRGKKLFFILKNLNEICRIHEISFKEILEIRELKEIIKKVNLPKPELYRMMKQTINNIRYPQLSDLRKKFSKKIKNINLPQRISLNYDNFFENEDLILTLEFSNFKELKKQLKYLEDISNDKNYENNLGVWEDLFDLLR